jgi:putative transposase
MARRSRTLKTIWRVPDQLWRRVALVLDELDAPAPTGRPRINPRAALDGIIYQLRTGCQWEALPKEFGDDSSVHRTLQRWIDKAVLPLVWSLLVSECDELGGVNFDWQSADGAMGKARQGGIQSAATPRIAARMARNAA